MAPLGASTWRRPYTSIYNDNYRYGTGLYSDTLSDIEKRYMESLSKTQLRSDRPDLALTTFAGSTLTSSPNPAATSTAPTAASPRPRASSPKPSTHLTASAPREQSFPSFESRLNTALHSSYLTDDYEPLLSSTERRARSLEAMRPRMQEDYPLFPIRPMLSEKREQEQEKAAEEPKARKINEPVSQSTSSGGGSFSQWKEKCRDLQTQLDELTHIMGDTGTKVREELYKMKGKFHTELNDLVAAVEETSRHCNELQRTVKSQANQLLELRSSYDDTQRRLLDSQEEVGTWQKRCQHLRKEMDRLRTEMDEIMQRSSSSSRF